MSIHQSKGLEFPVVALADLVKKFNTQDQHGEIIFDERFGLCPRVKPPQTERRYSSLPHWLARRHQHREQAGEELRLLYVAMTRARDTLILSGSLTEKKWTELWQEKTSVTSHKILSAKSYADWLGLWFAQQPDASLENQGELPHLRWQIVDDTQLVEAKGKDRNQKSEVQLPALDDATLRNLRDKLTWQYGFGAATEQTAKSSVTVLRRQAADELDDEAEQIFPAKRSIRTSLSAAGTGTAHHKFLQYVALEAVGSSGALEAEAERLEREKILSADERMVLDLPAIAAFWGFRRRKKNSAGGVQCPARAAVHGQVRSGRIVENHRKQNAARFKRRIHRRARRGRSGRSAAEGDLAGGF
ncbi:MAG: 3'-5' exonuclease [Limisphaerales bacterium]